MPSGTLPSDPMHIVQASQAIGELAQKEHSHADTVPLPFYSLCYAIPQPCLRQKLVLLHLDHRFGRLSGCLPLSQRPISSLAFEGDKGGD